MDDRDAGYNEGEPDERIPTYPRFLKYWVLDLFPIWLLGLVMAGVIVWYWHSQR